jgi:hypothetical protein
MLGYLAAHSAKEGLTVRPEEWPDVHCVDALRFDRPLLGTGSTAPGTTGHGAAGRTPSDGASPPSTRFASRRRQRCAI